MPVIAEKKVLLPLMTVISEAIETTPNSPNVQEPADKQLQT